LNPQSYLGVLSLLPIAPRALIGHGAAMPMLLKRIRRRHTLHRFT
jgi:hypothetical protein